MDFQKWWEKEGSVMMEGGCSSEVIARAAWIASKGASEEREREQRKKDHWVDQMNQGCY